MPAECKPALGQPRPAHHLQGGRLWAEQAEDGHLRQRGVQPARHPALDCPRDHQNPPCGQRDGAPASHPAWPACLPPLSIKAQPQASCGPMHSSQFPCMLNLACASPDVKPCSACFDKQSMLVHSRPQDPLHGMPILTPCCAAGGRVQLRHRAVGAVDGQGAL